MQDTRIIADIVNAVRPQADDVVIEIGPGLAAITEPLAKKLNRLHVIEIDRDIVRRLKTLPFADKLVIHEGDVLQFDFNSIAGKKKIVGNLPYNISTPLLFKLAEVADDVVDMHFMLQKEVVERMVAAPKSNDYGRLGVMLQYFFDMELLIDVPPESFDPAPKVDSAVVRMIPVKHRIGKADDFEHFRQTGETRLPPTPQNHTQQSERACRRRGFTGSRHQPARPCRTYRAGEICGTEQLSRP